VHDAFPAKHCYWTEGGPDYTSPDYTTDWSKWSHTFTDVLRNSAQCIVGWNLLLDEKGKPNLGPFSCGGVVTVDSESHRIARSGQYWAFAHLSKMIRRGAHVISSHGELDGIDHLAVENPDGSRVLVITNRGDEQAVQFQVEARALELTLDADSVTTLSW
jgi:glucosylceramidase